MMRHERSVEYPAFRRDKHLRRAEPPNPAPEYTEWLEHRYDPGYWIGRIPPYLKRRRGDPPPRNAHGYLLIVSSIITTFLDIRLMREDSTFLPNGIVVGLLALLQLIAGVRLLKEDRKPRNPA